MSDTAAGLSGEVLGRQDSSASLCPCEPGLDLDSSGASCAGVGVLRPTRLVTPSATGLKGSRAPAGAECSGSTSCLGRPSARGRFLFVGERKLYLRGVTYGTFCPDEEGEEFHHPEPVARDFGQMVEAGFNTVRTYTVPPGWFLDLARANGLWVMAGVPWEQHITFLDEPKRRHSIEQTIRSGVRACAGHPAILCYAIGNEIPASIVRWYGARRVERFIKVLYDAAKEEDPAGLVTYINYPSTEYLRLPFLDLVCFNVYLEAEAAFGAYVARLHNLARERPLVAAELGLDSRRNGEAAQAGSLAWQVRKTMASGCAGAFVFGWTDEWHRGGCEVADWDFGLTTRNRLAKPALAAVNDAFDNSPFPKAMAWPRVSVVVCTHNGGKTLGECVRALERLDYPDFEVIVVDDGSTDNSSAIASELNCRLIRTENQGLSSARNTGLAAATGQIVAYLDDDAYPDPHWLKYLAITFANTAHCGAGGPNLVPPEDNAVAQCVGNAPGGPLHVLLTDTVAEHIPGCNMAFRRERLAAIGGFDPRFRIAGDDVDICWRLQAKGWTIGYNPAAVVWHHRRGSIRAFLKQQKGYGQAEALLQAKWPEKFNHAGQVAWSGRLYGSGFARAFGLVSRIYHGQWGTAPFQMRQDPVAGFLRHLPAMPEWLLIVLFLAFLSGLGGVWHGLLWAVPGLVLAVGLSAGQAVLSAAEATRFGRYGSSAFRLFGLRSLTALLHLLQPAGRLWGRLSLGLVPGRARTGRGFIWPLQCRLSVWSDEWRAPETVLKDLERAIREAGCAPLRGGEYDRWDMEVRGGLLASTRLLMAVEEHGNGRQIYCYRLWPRYTGLAGMGGVAPLLLSLWAGTEGVWSMAAVFAGVAVAVAGCSVLECGSAMALLRRLVRGRVERRKALGAGKAAAPGALGGKFAPLATILQTSNEKEPV